MLVVLSTARIIIRSTPVTQRREPLMGCTELDNTGHHTRTMAEINFPERQVVNDRLN